MTDFFYGTQSSAAATSESGDIHMLKVNLTRPSEVRHYQVSEEQLDMLQGQKRDLLFEAVFLAIGAVIGSGVPAIAALWRAYSPAVDLALPAADLANVVVFFVSIAVAMACLVMAFTRGKKHSNVIEQIRNPKK